ncbi:hypothetical protein J3Q64DRAFT_1724390 [Phycomyces blakesleeanus]|uniref:Uncharacterized protein n=2 Tax=Phycomyces blakesleeanus TaxID=4837 RepID=A0A167QYX6_PHYB8|nr:hypothetical protein PHYBLDRAFT_61542 [Phycomyces blakesleeanus NRRL 1555(-)]OAD80490.1 hypothetical protein PHYBLDRAFT_61542 [Phycomyces blakesleeanus NRRL 1555(-)]|eukprot:XP_018298530.1 hypothetical protein PHYBLDRAFT_61542 [Phycomyces blakesleeanus NRRL 1555(-)]
MNESCFNEDDYDNAMDIYSVTLNGFSFCTRHGLELCYRCPTDNRACNNIMVMDMLHEQVSEDILEEKWEGDERSPFTVALQWTRLPSGKPGCVIHRTVGCKQCFNWEEKILNVVQGGRKPRKIHNRKARERKDMLH